MAECSCGNDKINDYLCEITGVETLTEKLFWLTFSCPQLARCALPGHCVMLFASEGAEPLLARPFAVADVSPERGEVSVCVSIVGRGTKILSQKRRGEIIRVRGLFGAPLPREGKVRLAGGGVGIAIFLLYAKMYGDNVAGVYLGIPGQGYQKFAAKIRQLLPAVKVFTDDGSFGDGNSMFSALPKVPAADESVWMCGPVGFFRAGKRHFAASPNKLLFSLENRMACGYGGCMGCVVETSEGLKRVCVDQSLFRADEVNLDEH